MSTFDIDENDQESHIERKKWVFKTYLIVSSKV